MIDLIRFAHLLFSGTESAQKAWQTAQDSPFQFHGVAIKVEYGRMPNEKNAAKQQRVSREAAKLSGAILPLTAPAGEHIVFNDE
jgi:hypothetical protein